jgi:hypothetical protein
MQFKKSISGQWKRNATGKVERSGRNAMENIYIIVWGFESPFYNLHLAF